MLLVTYRNLTKNKAYTFINVIGLGLGIAAFIAISAYVRFEKSYDLMHADTKSIYRVESQFYRGGELTDSWATSSNGYARAMKENIPGIASYARINWTNSERVVRYNNIKFREQHVCFADSNFFSFFSYPLLKGNPDKVLKEANTIVLSQSEAKKYFGNTDAAIGKMVQISTLYDSYNCMVTGVFKDLPANSTMQFNFLVSWATTPEWQKEFWYQHESYTFVKLKPGTSISAVEAQFPAVAERYKTAAPLKELKWTVKLVPLADIHLNTAKPYEVEAKGNRSAINFLDIMAYVILLIACINYINMATTKSVDRAREVGIRKVSGAHSSQLVIQFFIESFIINLIAMVFAIILVIAAYITLQQNSQAFGLLIDGVLIVKVIFIFIISVLLSGVYPATVLARLKPIKVLKGRFAFSKSGVWLRKGMVAFQFTISLLLIAGTLGVYRQIIYMGGQKTGVDISQTIVVKAPVNTTNYPQKISSFKNTLLGMNGVAAVSISGGIPGKAVGMSAANRRYGTSKAEERSYEMLRVDPDFIKMYNLQVITGRAFDKSNPADSTALVLNEAAVKQFGFASAEDAIGKKIWVESLDKEPNEIIGVVKNYHQQSLQQNYTALVLFMDPKLNWVPAQYYSIKVNTSQMPAMINGLQRAWGDFFPESSFDYFFLDEFYGRQYQQDIQFGHIFMLFSSLAVFIACMGLFGLTAYATARRTREIGVRKVLGASAQNIITLLTQDVLKLILFSSVFAIPAAVFLIHKWLQGYAFRAAITWWQLLLPVVTLLVIAIATTFYLTYKAAMTNPVSTLKDEG
jgi:putative ABC transport system permease protein